jgi:hypothetical protein
MKRSIFFSICCLCAVSGFSQVDNLNNKIVGSTVLVAKSLQPDVRINPNPVKGESFSLELQNLEKGKYNVYIFAESGKKYLIKTINYDGGTTTEILNLPKEAINGTYILQVLSKTSRFIKKMVVEE